jgi:hypothetical protein
MNNNNNNNNNNNLFLKLVIKVIIKIEALFRRIEITTIKIVRDTRNV